MQLAPQIEKSIILYNDFLARLCFGIVSAHFIVNHGENYSFGECLMMPNYYYSLLGSLLISFTITQLIYFTTCRLDRNFGWEKDFGKRLTYQLLFGVVTQIAIALVGAALYFYLFGLDIKDTRYIKFILPTIVLMILLCNFYYALHYFVRLQNYLIPLKTELVSLGAPASPLLLPGINLPEIFPANNLPEIFPAINLPESFLDLHTPVIDQVYEAAQDIPLHQPEIWNGDNILLLYIKDSITYVVTQDGSSVVWSKTIKESMEHLSAKDYFKIRPSAAVKRDTIVGLKKVNDVTYVELNFPFPHELTVSSRNLTAFKKWLKG